MGEDSFLTLVFEHTNRNAQTVLSLFLLTFARLIPVISLSPFFGAKSIPMMGKLLLGICLTTIVLPQNLLLSQGNLPFNLFFMGFLLKEVVIGLFIGFLAAIPFYIVQGSGSLIDHMRGSSSLQVSDPTTQSQTGPLGILYNYVLIVVFYALNGPFLLINGIYTSYRLIPADQWINSGFFSANIAFWKLIVSLFTYVMTMGIQLAAPSLVGVLMAEMFLGIANRLAPNVQIVFLGIPIKSWLGIALLALAWGMVVKQIGQESLNWLNTMEKAIFQMAPVKP